MKDQATYDFFCSPDLSKFWQHAERALNRNPQRKPINAYILCEAFLVPYWRGYAAWHPIAKKRDLEDMQKALKARDAAAQKALELVQALDDLHKSPAVLSRPIEAHLLREFAGQLLLLPEPPQPSNAEPMTLERLARLPPPATLRGALLLLADKLKQPITITAPHLRSRKSSWVDWLRSAVENLGNLCYRPDVPVEGYGVPFMPCEADWVRLASLFTGREVDRSTMKSNLMRVVKMWCDSHAESAAENHQT